MDVFPIKTLKPRFLFKLKININELQNLPEKQLEFEFNEVIEELESNSPITAILKAKATSYGVSLSGHVKANIKLICDRCLEEYNYHIEVDVNEDFLNDNVVPDNIKEYELKEGQFAEELEGKKEIDITDFVYQTVILEIPFQKLCKQECEGLEEYNKINSETNYNNIDERLEVFKSFSENNYNE